MGTVGHSHSPVRAPQVVGGVSRAFVVSDLCASGDSGSARELPRENKAINRHDSGEKVSGDRSFVGGKSPGLWDPQAEEGNSRMALFL